MEDRDGDGATPRAAIPYSRVVIGLTTIPARALGLTPLLRSVAAQSRLPDALYVSVPRVCRRDGKRYPEARLAALLATELPGVGVLDRVSDDHGPLTKLMGMLMRERARGMLMHERERDAAGDTLLVTVDDDRLLHPRFLEAISAAAARHRGAVVCFKGINYGSALRFSVRMELPGPLSALSLPDGSEVNIVSGFGGVAYPLAAFDGSPTLPDPDMQALEKEVPGLVRNDDLYISCWLHGLGVRKIAVAFPFDGSPTCDSPDQSARQPLCGGATPLAIVRHGHEWASIVGRLQALGALELAHPCSARHNLVLVSAVGALALVGGVAAVVAYLVSRRRRRAT